MTDFPGFPDLPKFVDLPCETIAGGAPTFPPVITVPMFGRDFPVMHGSDIYIAEDQEFKGVVVALGHPEFKNGMFMGFTAEQARQLATWLSSAADGVDGGAGKQ